jgi:hypothetical protein
MRGSKKTRRGVRIGDGLTLIAVSAVALAAFRSSRDEVLGAIDVGSRLAAPLGVVLLATHRMVRPGAPFWRARRPGAMACLASTVVLGLLLAWQAIWPSQDLCHVMIGERPAYIRVIYSESKLHRDISTRPGIHLDPWLNTAQRMPRLAGFVVAGSWISLALAGRWRPERSWIDRLGRWIGWFWIASAVHFLCLPL